MASEVGRLRHLAAIKAGRRDQHGFEGDGWSVHIEGACGECAVAKALGLYWNGSINTFKADDIPGAQIRTRSRHDWQLYVRPHESNQAAWILVTGRCPNYQIHGWLYGHEAKQEQWLCDHGGRPPAYFVPNSELRLITDLPLRSTHF